MSENGRTLAYIGVALVLGVVAVVARPTQEPPPVQGIVGKSLFDKFTDPAKAASLEIVKYDEALGEVSTFKVARTSDGLWSIPSHSNYPADAETQMKDAAMLLVNLTVLGVATEDLADHEMFGVIEPNQEKLKAGDKGVGLLVSFEDSSGADLGSLIIGKEVKGNPDQRFVRVPRQDQVFVVNISPSKLSTKFEDWIEKDLLKIQAFDVDRVRLKDHSVVRTTQGFAAEPRAEIAVSLDPNGTQWNLNEMTVFRDGAPKKVDLLPGEELNKEKLDGLKNALSDVKIADVYPKPKGLDATLKSSGDFLNDREAQRSLAERGFVLSQDNEIWSANGELQIGTKDGVEYVLRFGNVAGEQQDSKEGKLNRYLFVMARVDESRFPEPTREELPALPAAGAAPAANAAPVTEQPANEKAAEKDSPEKKSAEKESDEAAAEKSKDGSECGNQEEPKDEPAAEEKSAADKKSDAKESSAKKADAPSESKAADDKKSDKEKTDSKKSDSKESEAAPNPPAADKAPAPASEEEVKRKKIEAERDRITKENQRKMDKWKDDKGKAEEKVRELNARFAPWYYVISEDVYKKIHLSRSDILRESTKSADEGTGVDAFRKLEKEGFKKPAPPAAPGGFPGAGFPGGHP